MNRELRFGILSVPNLPWQTLTEHWRAIEDLGFDSLWVSDHFVNPLAPSQPMYECWTTLAAMATQTRRIRIGMLVTSIAFRNPAFLAKQAITVDHISAGRLDLGLGAGGQIIDHEMAGIAQWSPAEQAARFGEVVELVEHLLRQEVTTFRGRYYQAQEAQMRPAPIQQPRPPLTIAAHGEKGLELAARYADTWTSFGLHALIGDALDATRARNRRLDAYCQGLGRDPHSLRRSFLAGFTSDRPFASMGAFDDFVGRYRDAGIHDFIFYYPPLFAAPGVFERVATAAIPRWRTEARSLAMGAGSDAQAAIQ